MHRCGAVAEGRTSRPPRTSKTFPAGLTSPWPISGQLSTVSGRIFYYVATSIEQRGGLFRQTATVPTGRAALHALHLQSQNADPARRRRVARHVGRRLHGPRRGRGGTLWSTYASSPCLPVARRLLAVAGALSAATKEAKAAHRNKFGDLSYHAAPPAIHSTRRATCPPAPATTTPAPVIPRFAGRHGHLRHAVWHHDVKRNPNGRPAGLLVPKQAVPGPGRQNVGKNLKYLGISGGIGVSQRLPITPAWRYFKCKQG